MKQANSSTGNKRPRAVYEYVNNAKNEKMEKRAAWTNDTTTMLTLKNENALVDFAWNSTQYCENLLHELYYKVLNFCSTKLIDEICDILYHLDEDKVHIAYILTGLHYMDRTHQFNLLSNKINMLSIARYGCDGHIEFDQYSHQYQPNSGISAYSTSYHLHSPVVVLDRVVVQKNHASHDVLISIVDHLELYLDQCEEKLKKHSGHSGLGTGVGRLSSKMSMGNDDLGPTTGSGSGYRIDGDVSNRNKNTNPLHCISCLLHRHSMLLASIQHGKYTDSYSDTMQLQLEASLVIMFEYGEYIKSDLLADVCQQLFNIRTCGGDGQL